MNHQHCEKYLQLIQSLLSCPDGDEIKLLNDHQDLIDAELVEIMEEVAITLSQTNRQDAASWLRDIANQISTAVSSVATPEEYFNFLMQVFSLTVQSEGNPDLIYPFLQNNLDKLDNFFVQMWKAETTNMLSEASVDLRLGLIEAVFRFSSLIYDFPFGNPSINIEIAISGYEVCSIFTTYESDSENWASLNNNLGIAYGARICGKRAENLEKSINHYSLALQVYSYENFPEKWASLKNNLGTTYNERVIGNLADNQEQAISAYKDALKFYTLDKFAEQWATVQNNLGNAYLYRIYDDQKKNQEAAIASFKAALMIRVFERMPEDWAETQTNLGNAYWKRGNLNQDDNIELAIQAYQSALLVYSRESHPFRWAAIQNNLCNIYSERVYGDREENLDLAIDACQLALQVRTRKDMPRQWAMTQNNLGNAYRTRTRGGVSENLTQSVKAYKASLEIYTYEDLPYDWALTQNNLGMVYRDLGSTEEAILCFREALKIHTPTSFPRDCLNSAWNLGNTLFSAERWMEAIDAYKLAIEALENSWNWADTNLRKEEVISEAIDVYANIIGSCVNSGHLISAIEYAERSKTRNLVELLVNREIKNIFPLNVANQLENLKNEIITCRVKLQSGEVDNPSSLVEYIQGLQEQCNQLQSNYLSIGYGFELRKFQKQLDHKTAIVFFYVTDESFLIFIFTCKSQNPLVLKFELTEVKRLEKFINGYLKSYFFYRNYWKKNLAKRLNLLSKILHFDEIIRQIPDECEKLVLIPHRYLHLLPLHALPVINENDKSKFKFLTDHFSGGIFYAPSCQLVSLAKAKAKKYSDFVNLLAVQNPTQDLTYADLEVAAIQNYFDSPRILTRSNATKLALDRICLNDIHCVHFSCHGYFNPTQNQISKSALLLAQSQLDLQPTHLDSEHHLLLNDGTVIALGNCLTLDSIVKLRLEKCRLVVLSACETGLTDFYSLSDEYTGLISAFLLAGTSSIISTLWAVEQVSTTFLLVKFYENLLERIKVQEAVQEGDIAVSLKDAQSWLRELTCQEVKDELEKPHYQTAIGYLRRELSPIEFFEVEDAIKVQQINLQNLDATYKVFANPYYWAAFIATGV